MFTADRDATDRSLKALVISKGGLADKRLWIGSYAADSSTLRPRIVCDHFTVRPHTHVDGLTIEVGEAPSISGSKRSLASANIDAGATSAQDCVFDRSVNVIVENVDRCIIIPHASGNPMTNDRSFTATGPATITMQVTDSCFVRKQGGVVGHAIYEVGPGNISDQTISQVGMGPRGRMRDCILLYCTIQDVHRSRAEHQFCVLTRLVQDMGGIGPLGGVNLSWSFSNGTRPSTWGGFMSIPKSVFGEAAHNSYFLGIGRDSYVHLYSPTAERIAITNRTDSGRTRAKIQYDATNEVWNVFLEAAPTSTTGLVGRIGEGPWRMRNQTYRHLISFNPGWIIGQLAWLSGTGGYRDCAGMWHYDSLTAQTYVDDPSNSNQPLFQPSLIIHPNHTSDDNHDHLDVNIQNITIARCSAQGFRPSGISAPIGGRAWFRYSIVETVHPSNSAWLVGYFSSPNQSAAQQNNAWKLDKNVYATEDDSDTRFIVPGEGAQSFADWQTWTSGTGGNAQDAASLLVEIGANALEFAGNNSRGYTPDLGDYDAEILTGTQGGASGGLRQIHLAELLITRGYREWDYRLTAEAMVRWAFRKYKPTSRSGWPTAVAPDTWIGAVNYGIATPANVDWTTNDGMGTATITWDPGAAEVTRHVLRYTVNSGPEIEIDVWNEDAITIQGLTSGDQVAFSLGASDGWSESEPSNHSFTM